MPRKVLLAVSLSIFIFISSCASNDRTAPAIANITTSSKYFAKSDCVPTSLTITANIKDDTQVAYASVWYRVGADQKFTSTPMKHDSGDVYSATIIALDIPGGEYGVLEFYIASEDEAGNQSKSPVDGSVQMLPCVAN